MKTDDFLDLLDRGAVKEIWVKGDSQWINDLNQTLDPYPRYARQYVQSHQAWRITLPNDINEAERKFIKRLCSTSEYRGALEFSDKGFNGEVRTGTD